MRELKGLVPDAETIVREVSPRPLIVDAALELNCQVIIIPTVVQGWRTFFWAALLSTLSGTAGYLCSQFARGRNSLVAVPSVYSFQ